jgi:serine/threonine-protein kinase PknG
VVSDLYTVARTLAVLIMEFKFQSAYEFSIPPQEEQPILARYESLYRFLLKATRQDPDERFQSADEMADQLAGVLAEIVALETKMPRPHESTLFGGEPIAGQSGKLPACPHLIPSLKIDPLDPAAQALHGQVGLDEKKLNQPAVFSLNDSTTLSSTIHHLKAL